MGPVTRGAGDGGRRERETSPGNGAPPPLLSLAASAAAAAVWRCASSRPVVSSPQPSRKTCRHCRRALIDRPRFASRVPPAAVQGARVLDPYGAGGWAPQPHPLYGAAGGPPQHWCERPGRSSDPVTPVGGPLRQPPADGPFHATCPVHSPFRFRFVNGGPDFHLHHQHQVTIVR